jgi:hypothetical protein
MAFALLTSMPVVSDGDQLPAALTINPQERKLPSCKVTPSLFISLTTFPKTVSPDATAWSTKDFAAQGG